MDREEQNRLILAELARLYPDARPALHFANPFELLVAVMLSAQCTDVKVNMVTPALFAAYPDAAALAKLAAYLRRRNLPESFIDGVFFDHAADFFIQSH